ncbi:hypothetical protein CEXT_639971 [Caerostris extrusa]|uniref:Transmembrane protein n=1 Tax=Caerostris extrusa TaxID=172846 RepID=A0AAV4XQI3_CAEEX|nr:hypothetical protein CEXT_639971 [Caerostris extrusa]
MLTAINLFVTFVSFFTFENHRKIENKNNIFIEFICLTVFFISYPVFFFKICFVIIVIIILDFLIFAFNQEIDDKPTASKITQIIIIDCEKLNIEELLLYPTTEQYKLPYPILKPTINLLADNSLTTHHEDTPDVTIEMQNPTIDQLICYPTVEQYCLADNILKPTICPQTCYSSIGKQTCKSQSEPTPIILIQFGKP